jgi:hypothetical protein
MRKDAGQGNALECAAADRFVMLDEMARDTVE